jgi:hypothetical protein
MAQEDCWPGVYAHQVGDGAETAPVWFRTSKN